MTHARRYTYAALTTLGVFALLCVPLTTAHAGIFSYVSTLFAKKHAAAAPVFSHNSQNMALLQAALNPDPNPSKGGGDITVVGASALLSESGPSGTLADISEQDRTSDQISVYVVREGDSLSQIAEMFGVSVNTIVWANDIGHGGVIHEGQTLVILPVSGIRHTVASGDTIAKIAEKYGGDAEEIMEYNGFTDEVSLAVGDEVIVPHGEVSQPTPHTRQTYSQQVGSASDYSGYYIRPAKGVITQYLHGYNAIDLAAPYGTPVVAAASGEVIIARSGGWNGGYGNYIVIRHDNGTQTLYAHQSQNIVYVGQKVVQGQVIGYMGSTGRSTGSHVHFEVRGARNPFAY